jgi:glycosyltransferase involved in cell wall biosynthesis
VALRLTSSENTDDPKSHHPAAQATRSLEGKMELLLLTARWPRSSVHEFLDDEIAHLAARFDRVVVAPLRPQSSLVVELPPNVSVDTSLADSLVRCRLVPGYESRVVTGAVRAALPSPTGFGVTRAEVMQDGGDKAWWKQVLMSRADSASVANWAKRRSAPDLAYTFWLGATTVGLRTAWPSVPIVSRVHGGDLYSEAHGWTSLPQQRRALDSANLIASVSQHGHRYLQEKFPLSGPKLATRRLGIPPTEMTVGRSESIDGIRLLSVSSIDANKRVDLIAEVVHELGRLGCKVTWTHLGTGPDRAHVERMLADPPRTVAVRFPGQVSVAEVHRELASGDGVFINLSLSEGAPVSLMEAQRAGMPVVATRVGGTPEVAPANLNELVDPTDSVASIARAVMRAAARPSSERAERRDYWARHFNADMNYEAWALELHSLVTGRSTGG